MEEVALSLSGGGFRAAMFHLGTLSYLNRLKLADDRCFLDIVNTISTISGGTITGLWYMMNFCVGKDTDESFKKLYQILTTIDFPKDVWDSFMSKDNKNQSLIEEVVKFYDKYFFNNETFGMIMEEPDKCHIHHFSANGVDFTNGIAFRFQASRAIKNAKPEYRYGFIGNKKHNIDRSEASKIKLSEILAVSSCFPGGFEPLIFPKDFDFYASDKAYKEKFEGWNIPLMDGGIADNQGIEPILLASTQMTYDNPNAKGDPNYPSHDIIIVSDVSSATSKELSNINIWNPVKVLHKFSLSTIKNGSLILVLILSTISIASFLKHYIFISGALAALSFTSLLVWVIGKKIEKWIGNNLATSGLNCDWGKIKKVKFGKLWNILSSRASSLLHLASFVFMKPIRRLRYNQLYSDSRWKNRLISNIINELASNGSWKWKSKIGKIPGYLIPSEAIKANSDKAFSMGTTLWFTDEDKKQGKPEAILACGQYTICWNLLEYIEKLKENSNNTNNTHKLIMQCETQLRNDWEHFQQDPMFLTQQYITKL
jgi:predicted acylesterase/phospholipase RssA